MSSNPSLTAAAAPAPAWAKLASFRLIPQIEKYPAVVQFAKTLTGKLVLLVLFGLGLWVGTRDWLPLSICLAIITFLPAHRRLLVTASTLLFTLVVHWNLRQNPAYAEILIIEVLVVGAALFWCATMWPRSLFGRRPILFLLGGFSTLILAGTFVPRDSRAYGVWWDFTLYFSAFVWFFGYSLLDRNAPDRDNFAKQLGSYHPFWGSSNTPYAKGAAYLRRIEAKDATQLAVVQLKAVKLLAWSLMISVFVRYFTAVFHDRLGIPYFYEALRLSANHQALPWLTCWAGLFLSFFTSIMTFAVTGHRIVACCRMAGFNALRNTCRPMSSVSVVQFFDRYYFYFKELLVDFFFYPVFLRYFKKNQKLRLAAAIFAAACFGNAFFHFTRDLHFIRELGIWKALVNFQVYLFYCVILAAGITVSTLRHRHRPPTGFLRGQLLPSFLVVVFFCLLDVFGETQRDYPLIEHLRFFGHLFFVNF